MVSEQIAADLGPNGNGRIATSVSDSTVTISEEDLGAGGTEARANFGFSLVSAASSNPAAITAGPMTARTNPAVTFSVANAPAEGDRIRVAINQPDGTQTFTDLIVTANPPADRHEYDSARHCRRHRRRPHQEIREPGRCQHTGQGLPRARREFRHWHAGLGGAGRKSPSGSG